MIIVSQDRKFMINFDNVHSIGVDNDRNYENYFINFVVSSGDGTLGIYKTEERAKEILQEIIYRYEKQNDDFYYEDVKNTEMKTYTGYTKQHKDNTYYMPLE